MTTRRPHVRSVPDQPTRAKTQDPIQDPIHTLLEMLPDLMDKLGPLLEAHEEGKRESERKASESQVHLDMRWLAAVRLSEAIRCYLQTSGENAPLSHALAYYDAVIEQVHAKKPPTEKV